MLAAAAVVIGPRGRGRTLSGRRDIHGCTRNSSTGDGQQLDGTPTFTGWSQGPRRGERADSTLERPRTWIRVLLTTCQQGGLGRAYPSSELSSPICEAWRTAQL